MLEFIFSFVGIPVLFGIFLFLAWSAVTWIPDFISDVKEVFTNAESSTVDIEASSNVDTGTD